MAATTTRLRIGFTLCLSLLGCGLAAAQQVTLERESGLHAEPRPDAAVIAKLKQGTKGEAIGKQGPWLNVKTDAATGWLLSFNVRFATAQPGGGADASGLGRAAAPRQRPSVTSTIGVRGIEEEDLKRANYDARQMGLLEKYAASKMDGENAARASGLSAVRVEYMAQ